MPLTRSIPGPRHLGVDFAPDFCDSRTPRLGDAFDHIFKVARPVPPRFHNGGPGIEAASCHMLSDAICPSRPPVTFPKAISASASFNSSLEITGTDSSWPSCRLSVVFPEPGRPFTNMREVAIVHCRFGFRSPDSASPCIDASGPAVRQSIRPPGTYRWWCRRGGSSRTPRSRLWP